MSFHNFIFLYAIIIFEDLNYAEINSRKKIYNLEVSITITGKFELNLIGSLIRTAILKHPQLIFFMGSDLQLSKFPSDLNFLKTAN